MAYDVQALQRVIRYRLFRDENLPRRLLRSRNAGTVEEFLYNLVAPQEVPSLAEFSHGQKVEEIIRRARVFFPSLIPWSWFPRRDANSDHQAIAAAIDSESHLQFSRISFEEWVRYSLGYQVISVEWFLQQHTNLFLHLLSYLNGNPDEIGVYVEVEKVVEPVPFKHAIYLF